MDNLFVVASRQKFRFGTSSGFLNVEDLWDLPLHRLDVIAKALNKEMKNSEDEQSFIKPAVAVSNETKAKFDIVLHIIKVKMEERDAAAASAEKAAKKQKLLALIEEKKDAALSAKSLEELQAEVNAM